MQEWPRKRKFRTPHHTGRFDICISSQEKANFYIAPSVTEVHLRHTHSSSFVTSCKRQAKKFVWRLYCVSLWAVVSETKIHFSMRLRLSRNSIFNLDRKTWFSQLLHLKQLLFSLYTPDWTGKTNMRPMKLVWLLTTKHWIETHLLT